MSATTPQPIPGEDATDLIAEIERLEQSFADWGAGERASVEGYRLAIEALHGEALRRLVAALKTHPAALAALKEAVTDDVIYAVLRRHGILKASVGERVETALQSIRPMLAAHGGDVELVRVDPPAIEVRFTGACDGCAASTLTFHQGVKKAVSEACPEITEVLQVKGHGQSGAGSSFTSPFAIGRRGGWLFASRLADVPEGGVRALVIGGEHVILTRNGRVVSCFQNACAHMALTLDEGSVADGILTCPHHGFEYDLATGECLTAPTVALQPHAVRIFGDRVEVRLSQ